jgi:5-methylcytosine-specific restriction endonuclease McrA
MNNLKCLHCDAAMPLHLHSKFYCSIACEQEAELIRYVRRCTTDGRIEQSDVQLAIQIRLAHIMAGGYDKNARRISTFDRMEVYERAKGKCAGCGKPGHEIDHIEGPSCDLSNLQLLCDACHNAKTQLNIHPVSPESPEYKHIEAKHQTFWEFVNAPSPTRSCHDEKNWSMLWRSIQRERQQIFNASN